MLKSLRRRPSEAEVLAAGAAGGIFLICFALLHVWFWSHGQISDVGEYEQYGYYGYRFRLLYSQGPDAPGGAYDYLVNGRMMGGFAVIAWPVNWGETGVMTFMVSHNSDVYEKDLGPDTAQAAAAINVFNPDKSWDKADMTP